ncbi:hypothetical protein [Streptomyces sp. NPDC017890]|uniref:hypothetical protein n=1 Tax=Streptomyces sp. NPDC017890 TaxID=3365015 RepID=UPI0037B4A300
MRLWFAQVSRRATRHRQQPPSDLPAILGTVTGLYIHASLAVVGLSALVMHSSLAFTADRLIGAVCLVTLAFVVP